MAKVIYGNVGGVRVPVLHFTSKKDFNRFAKDVGKKTLVVGATAAGIAAGIPLGAQVLRAFPIATEAGGYASPALAARIAASRSVYDAAGRELPIILPAAMRVAGAALPSAVGGFLGYKAGKKLMSKRRK